MTRYDSHQQKFSKLHLLQLQHLKKQLEAREAMREGVRSRTKFVGNQRKLAYINEHDRIRNELGQTVLDQRTKDQLTRRADDLKKLFSQGNL